MKRCALCKFNPADKTGSHIVPHFLLKQIDNAEGETGRDKELGFVIEPFDTKSYIGRSTSPEKLEKTFGELSDEEIELKKERPLVVDHIFCSTCESRLAKIESLYAETLKKSDTKQYDSGIESEFGLLFWISVLWRMSINGKSGNRLRRSEEELIRKNLNRLLPESADSFELKKIQDAKELSVISYKLMRCPAYSEDSSTFLLFHPEFDTPYSLLIGEYILFISPQNNYDQYLTKDLFGLKNEVVKAHTNSIGGNENIIPITKDIMTSVISGVIDKIKEIRLDNLNEFFDTIHVAMGGEGKTMPIELKNEIMKEITSEEKKLGRKHTLEDIRDSTFEVLKKYGPENEV